MNTSWCSIQYFLILKSFYDIFRSTNNFLCQQNRCLGVGEIAFSIWDCFQGVSRQYRIKKTGQNEKSCEIYKNWETPGGTWRVGKSVFVLWVAYFLMFMVDNLVRQLFKCFMNVLSIRLKTQRQISEKRCIEKYFWGDKA